MTDINFSSVTAGTSIPANYEGFNWVICQPDGSFSGPVGVVDYDSVHVIRGFGFQIVRSVSGYFTATTVTASSYLGMPLDFTVVGYKDGNQVYSSPIYSITDDTFSLPSNQIDKFELYSNAMEMFDISAIAVTV